MLALALVVAAFLPSKGVLVPQQSLAGIHLGDTPAAVRAAVGSRYTVCGSCDQRTWLYFGATRESGLGVGFRGGRVAAVYTLGSPAGWRSTDGLRVRRLAEPLPPRYRKVAACYGYIARSQRTSTSVTTVFVIDDHVSGFALTRPSEPVCR
jgi:hypothetical protein